MSHGPLMLDLTGTSLSPEERDLLHHPAVGGVILFSRNYESPEQLSALIKTIHVLREPSLLVAVDQEGGRVQRFQGGFTRLPPAAWFGKLYDRNAKQGLETTRAVAWLMATELRACGVDFSFAPVLDLDIGISSVIGDRAFHAQPAVVAALAQAWMGGVHSAGMAAVGKHFPGHGGVREDSHLALPVDDRPPETVMMDDLLPFQRLIDYGIEAIMPAHVIYQQASLQLAGFSSFWLEQVLRGQLGFQGVVFSDDLTMAAAGAMGSFTARAQKALAAGCDMVLVCNDRAGAIQVVDALQHHTDPAAQMRLIRMHGRRAVSRGEMHLDPQWKEAVRLAADYENYPLLNLDL